jgi:hypothetical protein
MRVKSLLPGQAVVLSGLLNFLGVLIGGIAVAYALVELIPAEALSPPDGGPAVGAAGQRPPDPGARGLRGSGLGPLDRYGGIHRAAGEHHAHRDFGIGGTMVASGAGLRYGMISRIAIAWVLTLPITILIAGGHYYILTSPKF